MANSDKNCQKILNNGKQCGCYKIKNDPFCFTHSENPETISKREEAHKKFSNNARPLYPEVLNPKGRRILEVGLPKKINLNKSRDIRKAYRLIITAAFQGTLDENKAGKLIFALNGYCAQLEKLDLLERIEKLEKLVQQSNLKEV